MLLFCNIFCFLQLNQMLSPPKNPPNQIQKDQSASFIPVIMSAQKHLSNHNQFCTTAICKSAWENRFNVLKHQFAAVSWGEAALAAWVSLFGALSCPVRQGLSREREHRFPRYHILECGSAQSGLCCVVMSYVRADTSPVSLNPVTGLGEGHSAVLCSLPQVAPRVLQGFGHSWGMHRTPVCEDPGSIYASLCAWWGRMHLIARMRVVTSAVQVGVPRLNISLVRSTARALWAAVGLWMWPEKNCICP